jgi:hypothetical protein
MHVIQLQRRETWGGLRSCQGWEHPWPRGRCHEVPVAQGWGDEAGAGSFLTGILSSAVPVPSHQESGAQKLLPLGPGMDASGLIGMCEGTHPHPGTCLTHRKLVGSLPHHLQLKTGTPFAPLVKFLPMAFMQTVTELIKGLLLGNPLPALGMGPPWLPAGGDRVVEELLPPWEGRGGKERPV